MASSAAFLSRELSSLSKFAQLGRASANGEAEISRLHSRLSICCSVQQSAATRLSRFEGSKVTVFGQTSDIVRMRNLGESLRGGSVKASEQTEGVTEAEKAGWEKRMVCSQELIDVKLYCALTGTLVRTCVSEMIMSLPRF